MCENVQEQKVVDSPAVQTTRELVAAARMMMKARCDGITLLREVQQRIQAAIETFGGIPDGDVGFSYLLFMEWMSALPKSENFQPEMPMLGTLMRMLEQSILILADDFGTTVGIDEEMLCAIFQNRQIGDRDTGKSPSFVG